LILGVLVLLPVLIIPIAVNYIVFQNKTWYLNALGIFSFKICLLFRKVQRLHDLNLSGRHLVWIELAGIIPGLYVIFIILAISLPGTIGENKFGQVQIAQS